MEDRKIIELYLSRDERAITETGRKYGAYCHWLDFANIIDVSKIYYVEVNGCHYFEIDW